MREGSADSSSIQGKHASVLSVEAFLCVRWQSAGAIDGSHAFGILFYISSVFYIFNSIIKMFCFNPSVL